MFKNEPEGKVLGVGYHPGQVGDPRAQPELERQRPTSGRRTSNEIHINIGGDNAVIGRQVLAGTHIVQNEPPAQRS